MLGVAVSTVQLWTNEGLLSAWTTTGGHRRIVSSSVEKMIKKQNEAGKLATDEEQLSIVLVEDDAQQLRMYEKQLRKWRKNSKIVTAKDGYEGLVKIGQTLPSIIITDLVMPNMDGFQMINALIKMPELNDCTIIVISGLAEDEIVEQGGLPAEVDYFHKPIPFDALEKIVREKNLKKIA